MKDMLKELVGAIGSWLLQNIIGVIFGTGGLIAILNCARLWLRSAFSELYEFTFVFIVASFSFGFILGAFRRFEEFYCKYQKAYRENKKHWDYQINKFKRLPYDLKEFIYEIYIKGSLKCDYERFYGISNGYENFKDFSDAYLKYEIVSREHVRFTLNQSTLKLLKKHPELLDCVK